MSLLRRWILLSLCVGTVGSCGAFAQKTVNSATDLPRFDFPLGQQASTFLTANDDQFLAFTAKVEAAVDSLISGYTIDDKKRYGSWLGQSWTRSCCAAMPTVH